MSNRMKDQDLEPLIHAINLLRQYQPPEAVQHALATVIRKAGEARAVLRQRRDDIEWAEQLIGLGRHTCVIQTADRLEAFLREDGAISGIEQPRPEIVRQCLPRRDEQYIEEPVEFAPPKLRRYRFEEWRRGPNQKMVPVYREA